MRWIRILSRLRWTYDESVPLWEFIALMVGDVDQHTLTDITTRGYAFRYLDSVRAGLLPDEQHLHKLKGYDTLTPAILDVMKARLEI